MESDKIGGRASQMIGLLLEQNWRVKVRPTFSDGQRQRVKLQITCILALCWRAKTVSRWLKRLSISAPHQQWSFSDI